MPSRRPPPAGRPSSDKRKRLEVQVASKLHSRSRPIELPSTLLQVPRTDGVETSIFMLVPHDIRDSVPLR
ncbi:hypothetical protein PAXRUDRAFT_832167 [Paxillus rubicundulus Ve08.2h10]|uniref:Uncharacterized protein n=1 Tax=Paxillus rubicundulus Ve08.2h10 TaxID=930991 RepID=A0A0D0D3D0_9AGAM|nr:hypothetical protein PAXRUDRAFT_832167 [Paxillus rubicundulus Ve08.2h10]